MTSPATPRTPEQQRNDRRAGIGCGLVVLLCGLGLAIAGWTVVADDGTKATARILSCNPRPLQQPFNCRGIWSVDNRFVQGRVDGATDDDIGKRIDVRVDGNSASVTRGKLRLAIVAFGLALACLALGGAVIRSVRGRTAPR